MSKVKLQEAARELEKKRGELKKLFDDNKNEKGEFTHSADQVKEINDRNDEINDLTDKYKSLRSQVEIEEKNNAELADLKRGDRLPSPHREKGDGSEDPSNEYKNARSVVQIARAFTKSAAFTGYKGGKSPVATIDDIDLKTLMTTITGFPPETTRNGNIVYTTAQAPRIIDVIPKGETTQNAIVFMQETAFSDNAAAVAEAGTYPEAELAYQEVSSPVRKIAVYIPVTDEQMADEAGMKTLIENRLGLMVRRRLDKLVINGNGTAPNLLGMMNVAGIQTQAKGADPVPDAIYKAITKIQVNADADPDNVLLHPNDWQDVRLLRTADGIYIWGSPSEAGTTRIWGLPVTTSTGLTENTGIVGDIAGHTMLYYRAQLEFETTNSHADYFINGKLAVRCQLRAAFVVDKPSALCTVTGI